MSIVHPAPEVEKVRASRLPGFDGLRGLAATAVLVLHLSVSRLSNHPSVDQFVVQLQSGVQIFFVISGFVIARPFVAAVLDGRPLPDIRRYAWRRFIRIFPAYWAALIGADLIFGTKISGLSDWVIHLLLLQAYSLQQFNRGISIAWTLSVEVSFYVFLPFAFVAVAAAARKIGARRALVGVFAALLVASCAYVVWSAAAGEYLSTFWLPFQLPVFVIGTLLCIAAEIAARTDEWRDRLDWVGRLLPLWWCAAIACLVIAADQFGLSVFLHSHHRLGQEVLYGLAALFAVLPLAFGFHRSGIGGRMLTWGPVAYVGLVSYGLYLWHYQLGMFIVKKIFGWGPNQGSAFVAVTVTFIVTLAVASLSWFALERPLQRLSRRRSGSS